MNIEKCERKRTTLKPKCPNPLFEKWLSEWKKEASDKNSDLQYCFEKALQSLRKYPLKLNNGKECLILKYFGTQLCEKLDRKLIEYERNKRDLPGNCTNCIQIDQNESLLITESIVKKKRNRITQITQKTNNFDYTSSPNIKKKKRYVHTSQSGSYAILLTFLKQLKQSDYRGYLLKKEIIEKTLEFINVSFIKPDARTHIIGNSISTLINKGLILKQECPAKFYLTEEGKKLAEELLLDLGNDFQNIKFSTLENVTLLDDIADKNVSPFEAPVKKSYTNLFSSLIKNVHCDNETSNQINEQKILRFGSDFILDKSFQYSDLIDNDDDKFKNLPQNIYLCKPEIDALKKEMPSVESINNNFSDCAITVSNHTDYFEQLIFIPGDFEIVLLVDTQETTGNLRSRTTDDTIQELNNFKTKFEVRHLNIGDFAWIARNTEKKELLLPYIVERKRMDDLGCSIKDGRYHEQKFRLKQCGLQNVIYLIEKYGRETKLGLPINTLQQAIINTQIVDNFFIKHTNNHAHSMMYLSILTNQLTDIFKNKTLISCSKNNLPPFDVQDDIVSLITYQEFSKSSVKNKSLKVKEMFIKHLIQLKGLSVEKAVAITDKYPTPSHLIDTLKTHDEPELLLANIRYGSSSRNIGPVISKIIHQLYTNKHLS